MQIALKQLFMGGLVLLRDDKRLGANQPRKNWWEEISTYQICAFGFLDRKFSAGFARHLSAYCYQHQSRSERLLRRD